MNPWWNQQDVNLFERFLKAVEITGTEFVERVEYLAHSWLPARDIVVSCIEARTRIHPSGKIMVLDQFCPWKEHLHELEKELQIEEDQKPLYVLYEDDREKAWRIQAVAIAPNSFESRKALPEPWRVYLSLHFFHDARDCATISSLKRQVLQDAFLCMRLDSLVDVEQRTQHSNSQLKLSKLDHKKNTNAIYLSGFAGD